MTFEAYSVAVRLRLVDMVTPALGLISRGMRGLNTDTEAAKRNVADLEKRLQSIKTMGLIGAGMAGAGAYGLSLFKAPLEEAAAFQQELAKFRALGVGEHVTQEAQRFAEGMQTFGTSMRDNLVLLRDAQTIFGDFEHAKMVTPLLAKMKFANEALYGSEGGGMKDRAFMDMLKVIELRRGLSSEEAFKTQANMVQQVLTATGGRVGASEYLQLIKTGGVAAKGITDSTFYYKLEPLIQELGGMRVGTGLMSAYQNLMLGRTSVQVAKELGRLGLLDEGHVEYNKIGMIKRILPGGLVGGDVLARDPIEFLEKVLLPSFAKKGISSEKDVLQELGLIFSNRTASQLFSTIFLQLGNIKKNEALNRGAMGIDQLNGEAEQSPAGKGLELQKKWADVLKELGATILPAAIKGVEGLTDILRGVQNFARSAPELTKGILVLGASISGLMVVGGAVTLATAGFRALGLAMVVDKGVGLGAKLIELSGTLGKAGLAGAAVLAVGAIGTLIYSLYDLYKVANRDGVKLTKENEGRLTDTTIKPQLDAMDADFKPRVGGVSLQSGPSPFMADHQSRAAAGRGNVYLDGRKVGEIVTGHQARAAAMPLTGISGFDGRQQLTPAGGGF